MEELLSRWMVGWVAGSNLNKANLGLAETGFGPSFAT